MPERRTIRVQGLVQGVGFRPFVYGLAGHLGLTGKVWNDRAGVVVDIEGDAETLDRFCDRLLVDAPPPIAIEHIQADPVPLKGYAGFTIDVSDRQTVAGGVVSADRATCRECLRELHDPSDRRYAYPFLNCTNCGPRFTIVTDLPYDRERTTMTGFGMCRACRTEYENPSDRRFHAQPIACPVCGPQVTLLDATGRRIARGNPFTYTVAALHDGRIVAIKGLGGYHLACDAGNPAAVRELRRRKHREAKALAIMVADVETARTYCDVSPVESEVLTSVQRPVVLLRKRDEAVLYDVAPNNGCLGVMLPYTPVHHLLMRMFGGPLIMTSGNVTDEPMVYRDDDAIARLSGIADAFFTHDRPIRARCDDSVMRVVLGQGLPVRRSRGYAPLPILLRRPVAAPILACGGQLKNVFCLAVDDHAFLSPHNGDLDDVAAYGAFVDGIDHFQKLFGVRPRAVAHDLHPDYRSTRYAQAFGRLPHIGVQHHHAHIASCLADNRCEGPVIGVAFDGTGYGTDGGLWGGEFLIADCAGFERAAHLEEVALPGGEQAIRHPWRIAAACLYDAFGDAMDGLPLDFNARLDRGAWSVLRQIIRSNAHSPRTSSAGRLFDAVASLIGVGRDVRYEAQAAIELEALAGQEPSKEMYPFQLRESGNGRPLLVSSQGIIRGVVEDIQRGRSRSIMASRFHSTVAHMILETCRYLRRSRSLKQVALSGGVFQNARLLEETVQLLWADGFVVYRHQRVPSNDGGLALGQVAVASAILEKGKAEGQVQGKGVKAIYPLPVASASTYSG